MRMEPKNNYQSTLIRHEHLLCLGKTCHFPTPFLRASVFYFAMNPLPDPSGRADPELRTLHVWMVTEQQNAGEEKNLTSRLEFQTHFKMF